MNKVILMGRLTRNIDIKQLTSGSLIGRFTLAVDKDLTKDKKNEFERAGKPTADFINCIAFGKIADTIERWTAKGSRILVEGSLEVSSYEKDGEKRYFTNVLVKQFKIIDFKEKTAGENDGEYYDSFDSFESDFADDSANVHF